MIFTNINLEILGFVFKRLRNQEGIEEGLIFSKLKNFEIFKILVNVKFKKDKGISLTELEKRVLKESGSYISSYVFQKYEEQSKIKSIEELPYREYANKTLKDFIQTKPIIVNKTV